MRTWILILMAMILAPVAGLVGCGSKGPQGPKPGSPGFFWASSGDAYRRGDFGLTAQHLANLAQADSEYRTRGQVWLMAVSAGLARGDSAWADVLDEGGKLSRTQNIDFRRQAAAARADANQNALRFAELGHQYMETNKDGAVVLPFGYPAAVTGDEPPELEKLRKGILLPPAEMDKVRQQMQRRGVLDAVTHFAGTGDDHKKAVEVLGQAGTELAREKFLLILGEEFVTLSNLYAPKKLDQANRVRLFCQEAKEAAAAVPDSAASKALKKKIDERLKTLPKVVS